MNIAKLKSLRTGMVRSCVMCGKVTAFPSKQRNETLFSEFLQDTTSTACLSIPPLLLWGLFWGEFIHFRIKGLIQPILIRNNTIQTVYYDPQVTVVAAVMITAAKDECEGQIARRLLVPCQNKSRVSYTNINLTYIYNAGISTAS